MSFVHDFPFDPTAGYSPEQLLNFKVELEEPEGFVAFWQKTYAEAMAAPLNWTLRPSQSAGNETTEVFDIEFDSLFRPGYRVGGWLTRPRGRAATAGAVVTHGYGGRDDVDINPPFPAGTATIQPVLTGLPTRSIGPDQKFGAGRAQPFHVLAGIDNRDGYIHRFCVMDVWRAASVLHKVLSETSAAPLYYMGGSFGGGIGAMALAWDKRFCRGHLGVPSFGNHPLRLQIPGTGSGEAVRLYAKHHPRIVSEVLPYYDSALCARHVSIPVMVEAAFFDPAVTPVGQYSVYHSLGGEKKLFSAMAGHFDHAGSQAEGERLRAEQEAFFRQ